MNEPETNEQAARSESQQRFDENVKLIEQAGAPPAQEHPSLKVVPTVNAALMQTAADMQAQTNENGVRLYEIDDQHRARTEAVRVAALGGPEAPPVAPAVPAAPPVEVEPPQGTPEERAATDLAERLNSGDIVDVAELSSEELSGYTVNLPDNFGLDQTTINDIAAARKAGVTQSQLDIMIAEIVKSQQ